MHAQPRLDNLPALIQIAITGSVGSAEGLIANGTDPDTTDTFGRTAMWHAASNGHLRLIQLLLLVEANPDIADIHGNTPLLQAALRGQLAAARTLLDGGADVNHRNTQGLSALLVASQLGDEEMVRLMVASGADVDAAKDNSGQTALWSAAFMGHDGVVEYLIEVLSLLLESEGAVPDFVDAEGRKPDYVRCLQSGDRRSQRDIHKALELATKNQETPPAGDSASQPSVVPLLDPPAANNSGNASNSSNSSADSVTTVSLKRGPGGGIEGESASGREPKTKDATSIVGVAVAVTVIAAGLFALLGHQARRLKFSSNTDGISVSRNYVDGSSVASMPRMYDPYEKKAMEHSSPVAMDSAQSIPVGLATGSSNKSILVNVLVDSAESLGNSEEMLTARSQVEPAWCPPAVGGRLGGLTFPRGEGSTHSSRRGSSSSSSPRSMSSECFRQQVHSPQNFPSTRDEAFCPAPQEMRQGLASSNSDFSLASPVPREASPDLQQASWGQSSTGWTPRSTFTGFDSGSPCFASTTKSPHPKRQALGPAFPSPLGRGIPDLSQGSWRDVSTGWTTSGETPAVVVDSESPTYVSATRSPHPKRRACDGVEELRWGEGGGFSGGQRSAGVRRERG
eukprot:evm.model.scf_12EXC.11 EVM.evm.TU.scf_12EXC.11   scf_12EXC:106275-111448(+)